MSSLREGNVLHTVTGLPFQVAIYTDGPFFIPQSTGLRRSDGRLAAGRILDRYNEIKSLRPRDYPDVSRNASY